MWVNIWIWVCISVRIPCWECRWTKLVLTWDVKKPYLQKSLKQSTNRGIIKLIICHATYIKYMNQWLDWLYYCLVCPTKYLGGLLPPSPPPLPTTAIHEYFYEPNANNLSRCVGSMYLVLPPCECVVIICNWPIFTAVQWISFLFVLCSVNFWLIHTIICRCICNSLFLFIVAVMALW